MNAAYFAQGVAEYQKRLGGFCNFRIIELPEVQIADKNASDRQIAKALQKEGETILAAFNTGGESAELRLEDAERIELLLGSARFQISAQGHVLTLPPRTGSLLKLSVSGDALQEPD